MTSQNLNLVFCAPNIGRIALNTKTWFLKPIFKHKNQVLFIILTEIMSKLVMELVQTSYIGRTFIAFYRVAEYGQVLQNSALACAENDSTNLATLIENQLQV